MLNIATHPILGTILLLAASFVQWNSIVVLLRPRKTRQAWSGLLGLFLLILCCCMVVAKPHAGAAERGGNWLLSAAFLLLSIFVLWVNVLSRSKAKDVDRIVELERRASYDSLTQLYSRPKILSLLESECRRCQQYTVPVSVMMLDLNDFKFINDCYGHQTGDCVLKEIAEVLMKTSGPFAYLGRYGGDEFLAVLPNTTPFHAAEFAELLRSVVASKQFTCGAEHVSLTVSIGVTTSTTFRETTEELIASADNALYVAKLKGTTTLSDKEDLRVKKPVVSADRIRRGPLDDLSM